MYASVRQTSIGSDNGLLPVGFQTIFSVNEYCWSSKKKPHLIRLNFNYNTQMYSNQLKWILSHCLQIEANMVSATESSRSHRQQFIPAIVISLHSLRSWPKHSLSKPCTYGRRHKAIHVFDIQQVDYTPGLKPVKSTISFLNIYSLAPL